MLISLAAVGTTARAMAILGAHQSIVGGFDKAVERARRCGCDCLQLFTKNLPNRQRRKAIPFGLALIGRSNDRAVSSCGCGSGWGWSD